MHTHTHVSLDCPGARPARGSESPKAGRDRGHQRWTAQAACLRVPAFSHHRSKMKGTLTAEAVRPEGVANLDCVPGSFLRLVFATSPPESDNVGNGAPSRTCAVLTNACGSRPIFPWRCILACRSPNCSGRADVRSRFQVGLWPSAGECNLHERARALVARRHEGH